MLLISGVSTGIEMKNVFGNAIKNGKAEDAQLVTMLPISDDDAEEISNKYDVDFEVMNYYDEEISDDCTLRLLSDSKNVNITLLQKGASSPSGNNILISELFAKKHDIDIGSTIKICGKDYNVSGYMVRPDYISMFKETSDSFANYEAFGIAVAEKREVSALENNKTYYSIKLHGNDSVELRKYINKEYRILSYTPSTSNGRINAAISESALICTVAAIAAPVVYIIVILLIMLMLGRKLKNEQRQIGTLTALGYRSSEISRHYILYSLIPGIAGSVLSVITGYAMTFPFCKFYFGYYEQLEYETKINPMITVLATIIPIVLYCLIAWRSIRKMTSKKTIDMLRTTDDTSRKKHSRRTWKNLTFRTRYKLRLILEHKARSFVIIVGITVSTICVLLGWCIKDSIDTLVDKSISSTAFENTYLMNTTDFDIPANAEGILVNQYEKKDNTLLFSMWGYDSNTSLINMKTLDDMNMEYGKYYITNAAAKAYGIQKNDTLSFRDPITTNNYEVLISGIIDDNTNAVVYTSAENVADLMGYDINDRNAVISIDQLDLDENMIIKTVTKADAEKSIKAVVDMYYAVCYIITIIGFIIGILSMYLIAGMIIEENTVNISTLKILGYRKKEITNLILGPNTLMVILGIILAVPVTIMISTAMFASSVSDIGVYFPMTIKPISYIISFGVIVLSYVASIYMSQRKVNKIEMTESLKRNNE
jgi:putative ABC transport system permease protein